MHFDLNSPPLTQNQVDQEESRLIEEIAERKGCIKGLRKMMTLGIIFLVLLAVMAITLLKATEDWQFDQFIVLVLFIFFLDRNIVFILKTEASIQEYKCGIELAHGRLDSLSPVFKRNQIEAWAKLDQVVQHYVMSVYQTGRSIVKGEYQAIENHMQFKIITGEDN